MKDFIIHGDNDYCSLLTEMFQELHRRTCINHLASGTRPIQSTCHHSPKFMSSAMEATGLMWLFKFQLSKNWVYEKFSSSVATATCQVPKSHMELVATKLVLIKHIHHIMFYQDECCTNYYNEECSNYLFSVLDSFLSFCKCHLFNLPEHCLSNCNSHIPHALSPIYFFFLPLSTSLCGIHLISFPSPPLALHRLTQ